MVNPNVHSIWHGTDSEAIELLGVLQHNCDCVFINEIRVSCCASHRIVTGEQRVLDGLLFARRIADKLREEEGVPTLSSPEAPEEFNGSPEKE